jgi:hypothetical protein
MQPSKRPSVRRVLIFDLTFLIKLATRSLPDIDTNKTCFLIQCNNSVSSRMTHCYTKCRPTRAAQNTSADRGLITLAQSKGLHLFQTLGQIHPFLSSHGSNIINKGNLLKRHGNLFMVTPWIRDLEKLTVRSAS